MLENEKINFRQDRDFGEIFNVTVKFFRQNFKHFFTTLILVAGPFLLISAIAAGVYQASALGLGTISLTGNYDAFERYGIILFIYIIFALIATIVSIGATFSYMILYSEKGPGNFTTGDVRSLLIKNIGKLILTFLALLLVLLPFIGIFAGIGVLLTINKIYALIIVFVLVMMACCAVFLPNMGWLLLSPYLIAMQEKKSAFASIRRAFQLMRGNYWWTWVIMFCAIIVLYVLIIIFSLPQIIYQLTLTFSHFSGTTEDPEISVPFIAVTTICTFLNTILYSVIQVLCGFHYYSLAEKKDGTGLLDRIDEIGNTRNTNVEQHY